MTSAPDASVSLQTRDLADSVGFTVPHVQCARAVKHFLGLLEGEYERLRLYIAAQPANSCPPLEILADLSPELQALSQSVQIFASMAIESATNLYGVMVLGERPFYHELKREPLVSKLKAIFKRTTAASSAGDEELVSIASYVAKRRNEFVHPKPRELELTTEHRGCNHAPTDLSAARQASVHMLRFLELLRARDSRYRLFLHAT